VVLIVAANFSLAASEVNLDDINRTLKDAAALSEKMTIPENVHKEAGEAAAGKVYQEFRSEEFQRKLKVQTDRIRRELFNQEAPSPQGSQYYADIARGAGGKLKSDERLWILVSSSVPLSTLRAYAAAIDRTGDENIVMVMRGFIDGMQYVRPTMQWIQQALIKEPGCKPTPERPCDLYQATIQIDPEIFSRYGIEQVPAFVYAQGVELLNPEMSDGMKEKSHWVLTGDMSLGYALEMFHRETKADTLAGVIKSLRGEYGRRR
jgi:type-F conjugative transfer system pilin assembly protein TrbC